MITSIGMITALNPILTKQPELVNTDPYGAGWMIKMTIAQPAANKYVVACNKI